MNRYKKKILKYLRENGLFAVVWYCHSNVRFVVIRGNWKPEVYIAIYEEFWDKFDSDSEHIFEVGFEYGKFLSFQMMYRKLKEYGLTK